MNPYKLTLLAILAALAIVGRYAFVFIPNVQPVTSIIIITGLILGPGAAVILSLLITFVSNMLLGMGVWVIWQTLAWGIIGLISGIIGNVFTRISFPFIVFFSIFCGYFYGLIISLTNYQISGEFWAYYFSGLLFDTNHAIGNAVFMMFFYPLISYLVKKYAADTFAKKNADR